ncbi:septation protein SepH [Bifidobacterium jacchi]|uniref:DUF3071 domain-containing protein n=1 Tax=Bifidobacterium jacchi TaxID=2490545 RepID=A0A5N5RKD1_9BIFI|nr:septation protein SepH [Bifidobacterium jacchi]KAB5607756.1 DUF3071 domain-containing protein [Bifidobacterium jacchi]
MPEHPLEHARFDHVEPTGELVFAAGSRRFSVDVDETLERAILEAKQLRDESGADIRPQRVETLPISQIQTLIRAGAEPSKVAERYAVSEALVRRFSAAVETEKSYAIEQFLLVPAPKESRVRTMSELIERSLATARIGMESVSWKATRRGLEPWRITARFASAGRAVKAEWAWNMHDNAVVALNPTARRLLGELDDAAPSNGGSSSAASDDGLSVSLRLPGDSLRSARIERTVSQWAPQQTADHHSFDESHGIASAASSDEAGPAGAIASAAATSQSQAATVNGLQSAPTAARRPLDSPAAGGRRAAARAVSADARTAADAARDTTGANTDAQRPATAQNSAGSASASVSVPLVPASSDERGRSTTSQPETKGAQRRRPGRSAVPSWDEILFGE